MKSETLQDKGAGREQKDPSRLRPGQFAGETANRSAYSIFVLIQGNPRLGKPGWPSVSHFTFRHPGAIRAQNQVGDVNDRFPFGWLPMVGAWKEGLPGLERGEEGPGCLVKVIPRSSVFICGS